MTLRARATITVASVVLVFIAAGLTYRQYSLTSSNIAPAGTVSLATTQSDAVPSITAPISFGTGVPIASHVQLQGQANSIESQLQLDPSNPRLWMSLGSLKRIAADFGGALDDLRYASKLNFSDPSPHMALGDLYAVNLKEYDKAEQEYREVLAIQPTSTEAYRSLFELYSTTSYQPNPTAAVDIINQGITVNPKAVDLQILLAHYYRSHGDTADAKAVFDAAIKNATDQGQTDFAAQIKTDAASSK